MAEAVETPLVLTRTFRGHGRGASPLGQGGTVRVGRSRAHGRVAPGVGKQRVGVPARYGGTMKISGAIAQLRTTDLPATIRFYTEKLGLTLEFQYEDFYAGIRAGDQ